MNLTPRIIPRFPILALVFSSATIVETKAAIVFPASFTLPDDSTGIATQHLEGVTVTASTRARHTTSAVNSTMLGQQEMFRAACCNLGESFVTNPSVDVSYDDAATGASQIKLLGLSGVYVQMLTETLPAFRGAAQPFALSYVPGTWMKSINVSKGAASVKNGYESITGQIDIDYLKTDDEQKVNVNLYTNTRLSAEANADANFHLSPRLSTNILLHAQDRYLQHDMNGDGFHDMPLVRQLNLSNRWKYRGDRYIMHAGFQAIGESRRSGQTDAVAEPRYRIDIPTQRVEGYMKHAFILDPAHESNIAFMANASWHHLTADYGHEVLTLNHYDVRQTNINAQLMYETKPSDRHAISLGLSLLRDAYDEEGYKQLYGTSALHSDHPLLVRYNLLPTVGYPDASFERWKTGETVPGAYAQYTYTLGRKFTLMAGLRCDYNDRYGGAFLTPRLHLKWGPAEWVTLRAASGMGHRSPHVFAENHNLLASGRDFVLRTADSSRFLDQESAWNSGISAALSIPVGEKRLHVNAEYYYTYFLQQTIVDYEHTAGQIVIHDLRDADSDYRGALNGVPQSYSHVFQLDAQYELFPGFDITAAYRHNIVRCTYGNTQMYACSFIQPASSPAMAANSNKLAASGRGLTGSEPGQYALRERLLTPRFKALVSLCYQTPLKLWQFDVTLSLNGGGRLPDGTVERYNSLSANSASAGSNYASAGSNSASKGSLSASAGSNSASSGHASGHALPNLTHGPASVYSDATGDYFRPFEQLTAQVTRRFRHVDVYLGGENLTNRRQRVPILGAEAPFALDGTLSPAFEPTLVYAPTDGWMLYAGARLKF